MSPDKSEKKEVKNNSKKFDWVTFVITVTTGGAIFSIAALAMKDDDGALRFSITSLFAFFACYLIVLFWLRMTRTKLKKMEQEHNVLQDRLFDSAERNLQCRARIKRYEAFEGYLGTEPKIQSDFSAESISKTPQNLPVVRVSTVSAISKDPVVLLYFRGSPAVSLNLHEASDLHFMLGMSIGEYPIEPEEKTES